MNKVAAPSIHVREANQNDVEALARLAAELGYPAHPDQIVARLAALRETQSAVWVAVTEDDVVGFVQATVQCSMLLDRVAEIEALVVEDGLRGQGIGRRLAASAENWASLQGCRTMRVRPNIVRQGAYVFYGKIGYGHVTTAFTFLKTLNEDSSTATQE